METTFDNVIACFYEAALDTEKWTAGLHGLAKLANAQGAVSLRAHSQDPGASIFDGVGQHPDVIREYNTRFQRMDPLYRAALAAPAGTWLNDWKLMGPAMARSEWYNDFLRRYDKHAVLANLVLSQDGQLASVSIQRAIGQPAFSTEDERRLSPLVPHLRRAAHLYFGVSQLREHASLASAVFDSLHLAVWVLDGDGTVLMSNAAAGRWLAGSRQFKVRFGRLVATAGSARWDKALRAATAHSKPQGACLLLDDSEGEDRRSILVTPCTPASSWGCTFHRPVAVITAAARGSAAPPLEQVLGTFYGLTPAEARVARAVAEGWAPSEIAQETCTSVHTTRTQLKAVYSKTNVRRQSELARLVSGLRNIGVQ